MQLNREMGAGLLLLLAITVAIIISNTAWQTYYQHILTVSFYHHTLSHWVNDGLMTIFFFQIGLELKRERYLGQLRQLAHVILPVVAALGGVVMPILIYSVFNFATPLQKGWAIPMATDIAFAVGILNLFGARVSRQMKIFLLTLAIIDDLAAVVVIAFFQMQSVSYLPLILILIAICGLLILNRFKIKYPIFYFLIGLLLWVGLFASGIRPTLAGVITAFFVPLRDKQEQPILIKFEYFITPLVLFLVLPIFVFVNAGISFSTLNFASFVHPLTLGILLGLAIGKPVGIFCATHVCSKLLNISSGLNTRELWFIASIAGIGFTMCLYLAELSFANAELLNLCRLGIFSGSLLSIGIAVISGSR